MNRYLEMLVDEMHSAAVATIGLDGHPQIRTIDMMLCDEQGVYFLTARGKAFYALLMEQKFIALSAGKEKKSVSLRGKVRDIGCEKLDEIFEKNPYMKEIYPEGTRSALEVFCLDHAEGEYFDISDPACVRRERIVIGEDVQEEPARYRVGENCTGCGACLPVCPQRCIFLTGQRAVIDLNHCLHCGNCAEVCPEKAIEKGEPA